VNVLRKLGAEVTRVPPAGIVDQGHFVNVARRLAVTQTEEFESGVTVEEWVENGHRRSHNQPQSASTLASEVGIEEHGEEHHGSRIRHKRRKWEGRGWFADQFETDANWRAHYEGTGPEIFQQMREIEEAEGRTSPLPRIDAFVAGAGTGGTISGVGMYLKKKLGESCKIIVADPQGSGLYNKVKHGVFWSEYEREGTRRRQQVDTVIEGIGLVRSTRNWQLGWEEGVVDDAVKVTDQMARNMARWLVEKEGIWVGGSSAVNCEF
jgi:cysteine synthase